jgi:hypothetical protein
VPEQPGADPATSELAEALGVLSVYSVPTSPFKTVPEQPQRLEVHYQGTRSRRGNPEDRPKNRRRLHQGLDNLVQWLVDTPDVASENIVGWALDDIMQPRYDYMSTQPRPEAWHIGGLALIDSSVVPFFARHELQSVQLSTQHIKETHLNYSNVTRRNQLQRGFRLGKLRADELEEREILENTADMHKKMSELTREGKIDAKAAHEIIAFRMLATILSQTTEGVHVHRELAIPKPKVASTAHQPIALVVTK